MVRGGDWATLLCAGGAIEGAAGGHPNGEASPFHVRRVQPRATALPGAAGKGAGQSSLTTLPRPREARSRRLPVTQACILFWTTHSFENGSPLETVCSIGFNWASNSY